MKRKLAAILAMGTVLASCGGNGGNSTASSEDFPGDEPVTIIVPWGTGGPTDTQVRIVAPLLEDSLGTDVVVENRPGGGGVIGTDYCGKTDPDGHTLCLFSIPNALSWVFPETTATYTREDFEPLVSLSFGYDWLLVREDSPWQTMSDFVEAAKQRPGEIVLPVEGLASTDMFNVLKLEEATGIQVKEVVYPEGSSQKVQALLGGQVEAITTSVNSAMSQVESGEFRALAALSAEPLVLYPDIPTAKDQGFDVVASNPFTVAVPAGVPDEAMETLESAFLEAGETEEFQQKLSQAGLQPSVLNREEVSKLWDEVEAETSAGLAKVGKS